MFFSQSVPRRASASAVAARPVFVELEGLGNHGRPRIMDSPRAISSQPAAAAALINVLNTLRKSAVGAKPKLAAVRQMTSEKRT